MRKSYKSLGYTLLKKLKQEITSYDRYASGELKFITGGADTTANTVYSYSQWIQSRLKMPVIKAEGIAVVPRLASVSKLKIKDVHLFVSVKSGYSFKWHKDDVNVLLYVVKGKKTVFIKNKKYVLTKNTAVTIRRGELHRANSIANTWALSIGY